MQNEYIIARAEDIACYYDDLIEYTQYYNLLGEGTHNVGGKLVTVSLRELKKKLYLCLMCVNVLEAIRFYVSFACSFAFAERELMEGNQNPIPWINAWLSSDNVQVAPQEVEISSYLIGQIDSEVSADDLGDFEL